MGRILLGATAALALLLPPAGAPANGDAAVAPEEGCAEEVARGVQAYYDAVRDLSADFEQESRVASLGGRGGAEPTRASGRVIFTKPGRMRWAYREPEESLVISDGQTLWTFDPGLGEAQRLPVDGAMLSGAALQFLFGEGRILGAFTVRSGSCEGARVALELIPREPASYERLGLLVERDTGRVVETTVVDLFGNATRVAFHNIRINRDPDPKLFVFEPPEGVRVLEVPTQP